MNIGCLLFYLHGKSAVGQYACVEVYQHLHGFFEWRQWARLYTVQLVCQQRVS